MIEPGTRCSLPSRAPQPRSLLPASGHRDPGQIRSDPGRPRQPPGRRSRGKRRRAECASVVTKQRRCWYVDPQTGEPAGMDVEIITVIFEAIALQDWDAVAAVMTTWSRVCSRTRSQFAGNWMGLRPERCAPVPFTNPLPVLDRDHPGAQGQPEENQAVGRASSDDPSVEIGISEGGDDQALYEQNSVPDGRVFIFPDDRDERPGRRRRTRRCLARRRFLLAELDASRRSCRRRRHVEGRRATLRPHSSTQVSPRSASSEWRTV